MRYWTSVRLHQAGLTFFTLVAMMAAGGGLITLFYNLGVVVFSDAALGDRSEILWWAIGAIGVGVLSGVAAFFIAAWLFENTGPD